MGYTIKSLEDISYFIHRLNIYIKKFSFYLINFIIKFKEFNGNYFFIIFNNPKIFLYERVFINFEKKFLYIGFISPNYRVVLSFSSRYSITLNIVFPLSLENIYQYSIFYLY